MCQLNLYIIPKNVKQEKVFDLMKKYFYFQEPECITSENLLLDVQDDNHIYVSAGMRCNCGTIQSSYQNEDNTKSWKDLKLELINDEKEKLEKIRHILNREDYLTYKKQINNQLDNLLNKKQTSTRAEEEAILKEIQKLFSENQLWFEASMKYEKQKVEDGKIIVYHEIDEELKNVDNFISNNIENEFKNLKSFINEILKEADEMKLLSFWQDGNNPFINNEKYVFQDELTIEDVIYLKYNELLTVFKR